MLSPFSNIQFQLVATPHTIKHVGEKGEVQFSRCTPIFLTSMLSLPLDSFISILKL